MSGKLTGILVIFALTTLSWQGGDCTTDIKADIQSVCQGSNPEDFLLKRNSRYEYSAHFVGKTSAVGASDQDAQISLKCTLKVQHLKSCAFKMEFDSCSATASKGSDKKRSQFLAENAWNKFSEHPVTFTVNEGEVRTVLVDPDEPVSFVNLKKGFISAVVIGNQVPPSGDQHTKDHRDVQGLCPLTLTSTEKGVRATKELQRCVVPDRPQPQLSPFSVFWDMDFMKLLINSTLECDSQLEGGKLLQKLSCSETHAGRVDSSYNTRFGLKTTVRFDLELGGTSSSNPTEDVNVDQLRQTGIEYEYEEMSEEPDEDPAPAKELLEKLLDQEEVHLDTIPTFLELVEQMRNLRDVSKLTEEAESCPGSQRTCLRKSRGIPLYLEALVHCNRLPCVKAVRELHTKKMVSKTFLEYAMFSWLRMPLTDHRYFNEFLEMCRSSQSRFCWLGLGGLIRTYSQSHEQIPDTVRQVVTMVSTTIGHACGFDEVSFPSGLPADQKSNYIMTMLKSLGNMGKVVLDAVPALDSKILACAQNTDIPVPPRLVALETLHQMGPISENIFDGVTSLLLNETHPVVFRVSAYDLLIHEEAKDNHFAVTLAKLLKNDHSNQVKSYIAHDVIEREQRPDEFWDTLREEISKNDVDIHNLASQDLMTFSHVNLYKSESHLPRGMLPDELNRFGHEILTSVVFGRWSAIPELVTTKLNLTIFGQVLEFMEVGLQMTGLDGLFIRSSDSLLGLKNMGNSNFFQYLMMFMQQLSTSKGSDQDPVKSRTVLLNEKWEENIEKLYQDYQKTHAGQLSPHIMLYLKMLGLNLDYTTFPDIVGAIRRGMQNMNQRQKPGKGKEENVPFSETHLLNFLEAEHPVPTLMGAIMNWRTNFTLAASLDAKLDINMKDKSGSLHLKPRFASIMLNQMMLQIPDLTQIGIHCKNSMFSATQYDLEASLQKNERLNIKILPPQTKQRPMELNRNNYLVAGNDISELDDWDAERIEHKECLGGKFVKATGMNVCMKYSYLNVQLRKDKPFYFLAGQASWALSAEMEDKDVEGYTLSIELEKTPKDQFGILITGNAKGTSWTREIPLTISLNKVTHEFHLHLKHSDFPDFNFAIDREQLFESDEPIGYKSSVSVQDEGKQWKLEYLKSKKTEIRQEKAKAKKKNESPKEKVVEAHIKENSLTLKTPYNDYVFRLKLHRHAHTGNYKVDSILSYQNLNEEHNWLRRILPQIFWDKGDRKAWLEFRGDWRFGHHKHGSQGSNHWSKSHLTIPATIIEVLSDHLQKPKHTMHRFNVSKVEKSTGRLMLFANMTYNVWRKGNEGDPVNEIRLANLTLARHSWSLESHKLGSLHAGSEAEEARVYTFKAEKMIPKDPAADGNYIGWWSPESASRFEAKRWVIVYQHHLKKRVIDENSIPKESEKEVQEDISSEEDDGHSSEEELMVLGGPGVRNQAIDADVVLSYSAGEKQENLTFKGMFQWNGRVSPAYRTFLKTFTLGSTRLSLQLESRSVYTMVGNDKLVLEHHSTISGTEDHKTHGTYNLIFKKLLNPCKEILLNHSISSPFLNFASQVLGTCKPGKPKARLYDIEIHTQHPVWKELDFDVKQKFDLDMPGGETMNLTSPTMDIKVTGEWSSGKYHKKAEFNSKTDVMPTTVWELTSNRESGELDFSIDAPDEQLESIKLHRKLHKSLDRIEYQVQHKEKPNENFEEDAHLTAKIIDSHSFLVNGNWSTKLGKKMTLWLGRFLHQAFNRIASKLADPNHELNQNLKPYLQGKTVIQYLSGLQKKFCLQAGGLGKDVMEIIKTFESFYGPSFQIVSNAVHEIQVANSEMLQAVASSHIGWAWNYFEMEKHLHQYLSQAERLPELLHDKEKSTSMILHHPFSLNKFSEWPKLDKEYLHYIKNLLNEREDILGLPTRGPRESVAMVFGPSHVLTFDGRHYLFPDYPSDTCTVLLAQDVRGKTFSALISKESLFLIFPEMAVSVQGSGRLYINSSTTESPTPLSSQNGNIHVTRFGSIIRVESPYLRVDCDTSNEFCIFLLNPVLSGGIIGLLGNADGEKHNEFMSPSETAISKVSELGIHYEVSGDPVCKTFEEPPSPKAEDAQAARRCDQLLKQSKVQQCLKSAGLKESDIRPACVSDFHREGCPCATSKALTAFCAYEGFSLDRCQFQRLPKGTTPVPNQHDSWLVRGTHELQLVIILEAHKNVLGGGSSQALKGLETLLENIEEAFESEAGYSTITYALVAFGGQEDNPPHMHTQHRSAWMVKRDLLKSVRDVKFDGLQRGDPLTAVEFASSMIDFEPSATKLFLLITLDDTVQRSKDVHSALHQLDRNGAALYVLASYPGLERGKKVFGLRADGLIFPNSGGDAYGQFPRSPCAKLAAGTRGSIFFRAQLEDNKNTFFFETLTGEMLARVLKETGKCRQCTCGMSPWWQLQTYCKPAPNHLQKC